MESGPRRGDQGAGDRGWSQGVLMQTALRYLPLVLIALAWEAASRLNLVDSSALPSLGKVASAWIDLIRDGELVDNGAASLYRAFMGLLYAVVFGGALGLLMARS